MVKVYNDGEGRPRSFEATITDVDLPASVNYGYGATKAEAVADLRQRVQAYRASLHALDFTVISHSAAESNATQ
ncbi:MAG: hypothetical protein ACRYFR_03160 [Janthinobacterium lividum]